MSRHSHPVGIVAAALANPEEALVLRGKIQKSGFSMSRHCATWGRAAPVPSHPHLSPPAAPESDLDFIDSLILRAFAFWVSGSLAAEHIPTPEARSGRWRSAV